MTYCTILTGVFNLIKQARNTLIVAKNGKEFLLYYVVGEERKLHFARLAVSL